jgi:hypothetical protein
MNIAFLPVLFFGILGFVLERESKKHYPTWRETRGELNELPLAAEEWKGR